jgi:alkanesulfonate monooxygenase SsuD/methylene tetrahydromethanopterin reductase-like flavin-dependent oxidoreductase (luciferase family)
VFTMRFDMRAPATGGHAADLYAAAIQMCAWSESRGCITALLSEHHAADDGYLPSPLTLASAIAGHTERLPLTMAAVLLPFYDPVRLAEDMSVLDIISRGRVSYVFGLGYRPQEYEQFGLDMSARGRIADENLALVRALLGGQVVVHNGRRIRVTPPPFTPGGPTIMWGGGSLAAARRAGRYGLGLAAQANLPGTQEAYEAACRAHGHDPGPTVLPDRDTPVTSFVAENVDGAWEEIGPYLLHDARSYAAWNPENQTSAGISHAKTVDDLRALSTTYKIFSVDEAAAHVGGGGILMLAPLCGGLPPAVAWPYLERVAKVVLPESESLAEGRDKR